MIVFDDEEMEWFLALLEREPQDKPRLRELLLGPSVFDIKPSIGGVVDDEADIPPE